MGDVIIALVPALGHEGLVAYGPRHPWCDSERPMMLTRCSCGAWDCTQPHDDAHYRGMFQPRALVLYAPGGPKLGMVRALDALGVTDCWCVPDLGSPEWRVFTGTPDYEEGLRQPNMPRPPDEVVGAAWDVQRAYALAHLAVQRGLGVEVLVLPVTP